MNEALDELQRRILGAAPVYLAHAVVNDDDEAIHWIEGQGLYAVVTIVTDPFHGSHCKAAVGGDLYGCWGGRLHSDPLRKGEHVLLAMVEGNPDGHAVILGRISVEKSQPPASAVFRLVNEENLQKIAFDLFADGQSVYTGLKNGSVFTRLEATGNYTVQLPDGGVIDATKDDVQGGWAIKMKTGAGATMLATSKGVALKSPDGKNYLEVTDAGICLHGKVVKTEGLTLLNIGPTDLPIAQRAMFFWPECCSRTWLAVEICLCGAVMADTTVTTPCGVPIPINVPLPALPELPAIPDILALLGIWLPMFEMPTICPLLVDTATGAV